MRFNLANQFERERAAEFLLRQKGKVDITTVRYKRSLSQNAYYYLLLGYWGSQNAHTIEETKQLLKQHLQADIYQYEKAGHTFYRSSADLNSKEMSQSIERFKEWSREHGTDLPDADNTAFMEWAQDAIATAGNYL